MAVLGTGVVAAEESTDSGSADDSSSSDDSSTNSVSDGSSSDNSVDDSSDSDDSVDDSSDVDDSSSDDSVSDTSTDDSGNDDTVDDSTDDASSEDSVSDSDDTSSDTDDSVSDEEVVEETPVEEPTPDISVDDAEPFTSSGTRLQFTTINNTETNTYNSSNDMISEYSDDDNISASNGSIVINDGTINDDDTNITNIEVTDVDIDNSKNTNISFTDNSVVNNINFVSKESGKTKVIVKEVHEKPPVENVYKTFNIFVDNAEVTSNMENAAVDFKVEKTWLIENNLDSSTIILNMYEGGKWIEVPVTIIGEDSQYVYFKAEVSEYSTFAISSKTITVDKVLKQTNTDEDGDSVEDMDEPTKNVVVKLLELVIDLIEGN